MTNAVLPDDAAGSRLAEPRTKPSAAADLPRPWEWLLRWFRRYSVRYVARHFNAVRKSKSGSRIPATDGPLIVVLNHPAWWDPMICFVLCRDFPDKDHSAAIDARAFEKYRFFARLGFFGVEQGTTRGAIQFLRTAEALLRRPRAMMWLTSQGRFTDVRERPLAIRSGVGHLAQRLDRGFVIPLALEYAFWNERTPEALLRIGDPLEVAKGPSLSGREWTERIEASMTHNQDALAVEAIRRDPALFETIVAGRRGVGGVYDLWRRAKSLALGRRFRAGHGDVDETRR